MVIRIKEFLIGYKRALVFQGMAEILEGLMKSSEPGLASQLEYIVEQLTSGRQS